MTAQPTQELQRRAPVRAAGLGLAALCAAAYANSLGGALLLDDAATITENRSIRDLGDVGRVLSGENATTVGRPLLNLSFALDRALHGSVALLHVENAAVHLAAALLLFGVVRRTLLAPALRGRFDGAATGLAFATAAVWALHPLQTESVTYVCQRAESLMGFFFLATLYCSIRGWSAAAVAACALGVATKETAALAPVVVLLHDRTFFAGGFRGALRRRRGLYAGLFATWALAAALVVSSHGRRGSAGFYEGVSALDYVATQPGAIVLYLRLALWPHPLVLDRGARLAAGAAEIVPQAAVVAALLAATAWALVRRPAAGFLGAWFFLLLAPTSLVPLVTQTTAEHRMYLPLAAVAAAAALVVHAALGRRAGMVLVPVLAALTIATAARNELYASPRAMWEDVAARVPSNVRAHVDLGLVLAREGDLAAANDRLDAAVALDPSNAYVRLVRGNLRHEAGRLDDAVADYTAAAASRPRAPRALVNRAAVLLEEDRADEALRDLDAALALGPDFAPAYAARAAARLARREFDGAWSDVCSARRLGAPPSAEFVARLTRESGAAR